MNLEKIPMHVENLRVVASDLPDGLEKKAITQAADAFEALGTMVSDKPVFFYTEHFPHQWTSGESMLTMARKENGQFDYLDSLEEAKEAAEEAKVDSRGIDRCETSYGLKWEV